MNGVTVTLTWSELRQAALVGCQRQIRALRLGRRDRYGKLKGDPWGVNIAAAAAEMAVAKALDVFWADSPELDYNGDVGAYHVRSTPRGDGALILHRADLDDSVYVLVTGEPPTLHVAGWMLGAEGKHPDFWQTHTGRPCYFVPQAALQPMTLLVYAKGPA